MEQSLAIFEESNVVHVYDLVDWVTQAGLTAGKRAARYATGGDNPKPQFMSTAAGENVRYVVPHQIDPETLTQDRIMLQMRVTQPLEHPVQVQLTAGDTLIAKKNERYARPGEMVSLTLKEKDYDAVRKAQELKVSVVPR